MTNPSRRGVLRAAAWSTPAVLIAGTSPAYATSTPESEPEALQCEVRAWRTNHGHKTSKGGKPVSGTHHFHISANCFGEKLKGVWIAGQQAVEVEGVWTVEYLRGGTHQNVIIVTEPGRRTTYNSIFFKPEN